MFGPYLNMPQHIFQQDGAPPKWLFTEVCDFQNGMFNNNWCGHREPSAWPPTSLKLTPHNFFVWGFVKNTVYIQ
jgi:hypothetical protein